MSHRPTPIADELELLAAFLAGCVRSHRPPTAADLQRIAHRLAELGRKSAEFERFHADLVSDAQEDELRQSTGRSTAPIAVHAD